ncbi:uncharacterized protein LOC105691395 [Athalia rosae]|uniref:uncharacterized protein LOC105691395 n=1 Tax=Athalia rosae TaxID=37344 RepID=UPI0006267956|nr:uncharacterized protein LOC105691395 [Athalia rosae]
MDDPMVEELRVYSRRLVERLKDKEAEVADLQEKFSKLQGRYSQLDYAFRKNLELHQHHMMEIYDLRLAQAELSKTEKNRRKQLYKMENQLINVTREKEVAKSDLAYWKQSLIDQKQFYEG